MIYEVAAKRKVTQQQYSVYIFLIVQITIPVYIMSYIYLDISPEISQKSQQFTAKYIAYNDTFSSWV